jgi:hypothetical protein
MKKTIISALALALLVLTLASCAGMGAGETGTTEAGAQSTQAKTEAEKPAYSDALGLLGIIYEKYNSAQTSEEARLAVGGGNVNNFETCNPEGPAAFSPLAPEDYDQNLGIPVSETDKIASAASMFNMMNANTFTCYTVQLKEGADVDAFINATKENVLARRWICGSPEKLVIAKAPGRCVIAMWGVVESGGLINPVAESFARSVPGSEIVVEHSFAG